MKTKEAYTPIEVIHRLNLDTAFWQKEFVEIFKRVNDNRSDNRYNALSLIYALEDNLKNILAEVNLADSRLNPDE